MSGGPHAVASRTVGGSTASYSYDAVGNMVGVTEGASSTTLGWDARNRLSSWSDGTTTHTFTYDAAGERVTSSDGTLTTIFLGDVEVGSDGTARTLYRFAGGLVAIRTTTGTSTTLELVVTDHLGSPQVTWDPVSQAVSGSRLHRPYGTTRDETGTLPGTVGYTGQHQDPTGLAYYGARYYDPTLMVFISADTIIPDPSIPADLNRYGYVRGDPMRYVDSSAEEVWLRPEGGCSYAFTHWTVAYRKAVFQELYEATNASELVAALQDFLNWEYSSGRVTGQLGDSDWWSYVNAQLVFDIRRALDAYSSGQLTVDDEAVQAWVDLIRLAADAPGLDQGPPTSPLAKAEIPQYEHAFVETFWNAHQRSLHKGIHGASRSYWSAEPQNEQRVIRQVVTNVDQAALHLARSRWLMQQVSWTYPGSYPGTDKWWAVFRRPFNACIWFSCADEDVGIWTDRWGP